MKIYSLVILMSLIVFGLAGCNSGGSNTTVNTTFSNANGMNGNTANANMMNANAGMTNANMTNGNTNAGMKGNGADLNSFMTQAAAGGMAEVELGRLAGDKAQNAEVKKFGQMMVQDHSNANTELKSLAAKKNVTLPTEMDAEHKAMRDKLNGLSGAEFDREYMRGQVADHEKTVALFEQQAQNGTDPDAKAWAEKTLPKLKMHLDMARSINGKLQ